MGKPAYHSWGLSLLLFLLTGWPAPLGGQLLREPAASERGRWEETFYAGALLFDRASGILTPDDELVAGLRLGYSLTPWLAIEGSFGWSPSEIGATQQEAQIFFGQAQARLTLWRARYVQFGEWQAFATGGVGVIHHQTDRVTSDELMGTVGVGVLWLLTRKVALRADLRDLIVPVESLNTTFHHLELSGGLTLFFHVPHL